MTCSVLIMPLISGKVLPWWKKKNVYRLLLKSRSLTGLLIETCSITAPKELQMKRVLIMLSGSIMFKYCQISSNLMEKSGTSTAVFDPCLRPVESGSDGGLCVHASAGPILQQQQQQMWAWLEWVSTGRWCWPGVKLHTRTLPYEPHVSPKGHRLE